MSGLAMHKQYISLAALRSNKKWNEQPIMICFLVQYLHKYCDAYEHPQSH